MVWQKWRHPALPKSQWPKDDINVRWLPIFKSTSVLGQWTHQWWPMLIKDKKILWMFWTAYNSHCFWMIPKRWKISFYYTHQLPLAMLQVPGFFFLHVLKEQMQLCLKKQSNRNKVMPFILPWHYELKFNLFFLWYWTWTWQKLCHLSHTPGSSY
jgi:hypothetical protein